MVRKILFIVVLLQTGVCFGQNELNVDVFWGWGGCYRPMEWTPAEIEITSTFTEPFGGLLQLSVPQDGLNTMNVWHPFALTPGLPLHIPLVVRLAYISEQADLRIVDERNRTVWSHRIDLWDYRQQKNPLTPIQEDDMLIGLVGSRKFDIIALPDKTVTRTLRNAGQVFVRDKLVNKVPWDWTAFSSLDLLILYDPDWNLFRDEQLDAICQWISNGGKVLIILGSNLMPENPLRQILPFEIERPVQMALAGDSLRNLGIYSQTDLNSICSIIKPKSGYDFVQLFHNDSKGSLFASSCVGFGSVAVLGFDPSMMFEGQSVDSIGFWVSLIRQALNQASTDPQTTISRGRNVPITSLYDFRYARTIMVKDQAQQNQPDQSRYSYYTTGIAQSGNNSVMEHLYHISQLRPLSIWWVIALLILFAVLLGPFDYILLKRLDKLPLTWITSCCWIIIFSVGAYYGVAAIRGGSLALRVVSVIDSINGTNHNWATYYSGIFAPKSADYKLEGLSDKQWWSGLAPSEEMLYAARGREIVGRSIYFEQSDGKNLPFSLPVSIWTMQCLLAEWPIEKIQAEAAVSKQADNVVIKIVNNMDKPVTRGYVLFAENRSFGFESVDAKSQKEFSGRIITSSGWRSDTLTRNYGYSYSQQISITFEPQNAFFGQGVLQRTRAIDSMLRLGAAVVCLEYEDAPVPFKIKGRSYQTSHIQIVRLLVMPQVN